MNVLTQLSDKLEVFRIDGFKPSWIGLDFNVLAQLNFELSEARGVEVNVLLTKFLEVPVISMGGPLLPADGIYIHHREES